MCKAIEDMRKEAEWQTKAKSVLRWLAKGVSIEDIAECEDLTIEEVRELANSKSA